MGRAVKYGAAAGWGWDWDWVGPPQKKKVQSVKINFRVPWRQRPHPHAPGAADSREEDFQGPPPFRASKFAGTDPSGGTVGGKERRKGGLFPARRGWMDRKSKWMGTERERNGTGTGTARIDWLRRGGRGGQEEKGAVPVPVPVPGERRRTDGTMRTDRGGCDPPSPTNH